MIKCETHSLKMLRHQNIQVGENLFFFLPFTNTRLLTKKNFQHSSSCLHDIYSHVQSSFCYKYETQRYINNSVFHTHLQQINKLRTGKRHEIHHNGNIYQLLLGDKLIIIRFSNKNRKSHRISMSF